LKNLTL